MSAIIGARRPTLVEAVITFLLVLVGIPATGGAVNPARALGPFVVDGVFPMVQVYLLAPLLGGVVAALTYNRVIRPAEPPKA